MSVAGSIPGSSGDLSRGSQTSPAPGLAELFAAQVIRSPEAVAAESGDETVSYRDLDGRANRLAHYLAARGVCPGDRVAIASDRGVSFLLAMLGIVKAGAAYVPLDLRNPPARLRAILSDTAARAVVTTDGRASLSTASSTRSPGNRAPAPPSAPGPRACGGPKGIVVPHRAVARLVRETNYVSIRPNDRIAQASSIAFDAATFEIWGALLNGACLVTLPSQDVLAPARLAKLLRTRNISILFLTTSLFNLVAQEEPSAFGSLRYLLFGGEAARPESVRAVLAEGAPEHLINGYGPTENTTFSTYCEVETVPEDAQSVPIGRPVTGTQALILDPDRKPVSAGSPGELWLGGEGLACGYLNDAQLTSERFATLAHAPGRWYRSGDRVRQLTSGEIEFIGRSDRQLKVRGFRFEPAEIEAVLERLDDVSHCVVMAREDQPGEQRLVAYCQPATGIDLDAGELIGHLRDRLPDHMIPTAIVPLKTFPLNLNGKVDLEALPPPSPEHRAGSLPREPPRTEAERALAKIWSELLGIEEIGLHDNFFELGGHSLLAVSLVDLVNLRLDAQLAIGDLFAHQTLADLAQTLPGTSTANTSHRYLEVVQRGSRPGVVVAVGLPLRALPELLPKNTTILWMKMDGVHVQPDLGLDIPQLAERYAHELVQAVPAGGVILAGYSYGGLLALSLGRRLLDAHGRRAELILLEPTVLTAELARRVSVEGPEPLTRWVAWHWSQAVEAGPRQWAAYGGSRMRAKATRVATGVRLGLGLPTSDDERERYLEPDTLRNVARYEGEMWPGDAHLFGGREYLDATTSIWQRYVKGTLEPHEVPGAVDHLDLKEPENASAWISVIRRLLPEGDE